MSAPVEAQMANWLPQLQQILLLHGTIKKQEEKKKEANVETLKFMAIHCPNKDTPRSLVHFHILERA